MARILLSESSGDLERLLARMIARLGHEPVTVEVLDPALLRGADALVVEPVTTAGALVALGASLANPALPIVCASVAPPPAELVEMGVVFAAALMKPFTVQQLGDAIAAALGECRGRRDCAA